MEHEHKAYRRKGIDKQPLFPAENVDRMAPGTIVREICEMDVPGPGIAKPVKLCNCRLLHPVVVSCCVLEFNSIRWPASANDRREVVPNYTPSLNSSSPT